ncbi:hypothetical protein [Lysinibacillus sp. NPDC092081]|uniref:hypothetical protein n=1 Tax=Lysinibacillus sp. NPDC092081 TaxID=3364131 RepID=UPI0038121915
MSNFLNNLIQPAAAACSQQTFYKWCQGHVNCATQGMIGTLGKWVDKNNPQWICDGNIQFCNCGCTK